MIRLRKCSRPRRGVAAAELALLLPVLLSLLLGIWEIGRLINVSQILNNAAREGARAGAGGKLTASQVQDVVTNALKNENIPTTNVQVTVSDLTNPGTDPTAAAQMDAVQVQVQIPFSDVRWIALNHFLTSSSILKAQAIWYSLKDQQYPTSVSSPAGS